MPSLMRNILVLAAAAATASLAATPTGACDLRDSMIDHQRLDNMLAQKFDHYVYGSKPTENFNPISPEEILIAIPPGAGVLFYRLSSDELDEFDLGAAMSGSMRDSLSRYPPKYLCVWLFDDTGEVARAQVPLEAGAETQALALADGIRASLRRGDETRGWRSPNEQNVVLAEYAQNATASEPPSLLLHAASDLLLPRTVREGILARGYERLIVVPSRNLGSIPFAALPLDGERQLIDVASILIAPSFGVFQKPPIAGNMQGSLVVGDPELTRPDRLVKPGMFKPLPGARDEAKVVADMLRTKPLIGAAATQAAVTKAINKSDLIYFATHGAANDQHPNDRSYLLLSDGAFTAREIAKLRMQRSNRIVVMSACQTGLGKSFQSGVIGLAKAWQYAGVDTVVMTLWSVFDAPTRDLMVDFMRSLREDGLAADVALREAMLKARKRAPHPIYWAGFAVYGSPLAPPLASTAMIDPAIVKQVHDAIDEEKKRTGDSGP